MAWPAKGVANLFLDLAEESGLPIDPLTMQKLVYFAEGWHLALLDTSLVIEQFEAWKRGPVVPALYHALKGYGSSPIRDCLVVAEIDIPRQRIQTVEARRPTETESQDLVREVWRVYRRYSGGQLVALTHQQGSPWEMTWRQANGAPDARIPKDHIRAWFRAEADRST